MQYSGKVYFFRALVVLVFFSFLSNGLRIDVGINLTLAYFTLSLIFIIPFQHNGIIKKSLYINAIPIYAFYLFSILTVIYSIDTETTIRYVFGAILLLYFFTITVLLFQIEKINLLDTLNKLVVFYVLGTLIYYTLGLLSFDSLQEHSKYYGIFVEKSLPRLIGFTIDPNFAALTLLFCFFIALNNRSKFGKVILVLCLFLIAATLSRSGLLALLFSMLFGQVLSGDFKKLALSIGGISFLILLTIMLVFFGYADITELIEKRISGIRGGAGRLDLWSNALTLFEMNPIFGSGAFTFRELNELFFDSDRFAHNTYIEVMVEMGAVGGFLFLLMNIHLFYLSYTLRRIYSFMLPISISFIIMSATLSLYINTITVFYFVLVLLAYEESKKSMRL